MEIPSAFQISWNSLTGNLLFTVSEAIQNKETFPTWKKVAVYALKILFVYPALLVTASLDLAFWSAKSAVLLVWGVTALLICDCDTIKDFLSSNYFLNHLKDLTATVALPILGLAHFLANRMPQSNRPGSDYTLDLKGFEKAARNSKSNLMKQYDQKLNITFYDIDIALAYVSKFSEAENYLIDISTKINLQPDEKEKIVKQFLRYDKESFDRQKEVYNDSRRLIGLSRLINSGLINFNDRQLITYKQYQYAWHMTFENCWLSILEVALLRCDDNLIKLVLECHSLSEKSLNFPAFLEFFNFLNKQDPQLTIKGVLSDEFRQNMTNEERDNYYYKSMCIMHSDTPYFTSNFELSVFTKSLSRVAHAIQQNQQT